MEPVTAAGRFTAVNRTSRRPVTRQSQWSPPPRGGVAPLPTRDAAGLEDLAA